jgi:DNA helicase HerA-like ATPase
VRLLGEIVEANLTEGFVVRLLPNISPESLSVGQYLVVQGERQNYITIVKDIDLAANQERLADVLVQNLPDEGSSNELLKKALKGRSLYIRVTLKPLLMIPKDTGEEVRLAKSVPPHLSPAREAIADDIERVFGKADGKQFFPIGKPLGVDYEVVLDSEKLLKRSTGIFAVAGSGKTFLAKIVAGNIIKGKLGIVLVYDMHNEYGFSAIAESAKPSPGLKRLFPHNVSVVTLDPDSSEKFDYPFYMTYEDVEIEDVILTKHEMDLTQAMIDALYILGRKLGKKWLKTLLDDNVSDEEVAELGGLHEATAPALRRRLKARMARFGFMAEAIAQDKSGIAEVVDLIKRGNSVVLEFGRYGDDLSAYIIASNIISRRIHDMYVSAAVQEKKAKTKSTLKPLMIFIEEAHKFLGAEAANLSVFGTIARELRKYKVTLCIIDQRPSQIEEDVRSQIWTRMIMAMVDERDIRAALAGVANADDFKQIIASLQQQEALLFGYAVPVPVTIRVKNFDQELFDYWESPSSMTDSGPLSDDEARKQLEE